MSDQGGKVVQKQNPALPASAVSERPCPKTNQPAWLINDKSDRGWATAATRAEFELDTQAGSALAGQYQAAMETRHGFLGSDPRGTPDPRLTCDPPQPLPTPTQHHPHPVLRDRAAGALAEGGKSRRTHSRRRGTPEADHVHEGGSGQALEGGRRRTKVFLGRA
ncbi:uncharacterized protein LOC110312773 [Mus pahari]|uniref:uncharacterized protein LOC110312773 n=1 Tax=Mus pahari TaxID=10093 RepID=UPI000A30E5CC|nr:uncharacterized protein LOC110312773 [Mus pahari]